MKDLNVTNEELEALKTYRNNKYEAINQMLISDCENDIALLSADVENKVVSIAYDRESVIEYLRTIKLVYRLILKKYYTNQDKKKINLYRGTNLSEIERISNEIFIDRFLMCTTNEEYAINEKAAIWNRPACINISLDNDVPYVFLNDILDGKEYKDEVLISPFTKLKSIKEEKEIFLNEKSKTVKKYNVQLEKQVLDELKEEQRRGLYNYILENSYSIKRKIEKCIELEAENTINFENIRKLEQLLNKYENSEERDADDIETDMEIDYDDISRISKQLEELKKISTDTFEIRKENINFVNNWKRNIAVYMIAECREIEKEIEQLSKNNTNVISNNDDIDEKINKTDYQKEDDIDNSNNEEQIDDEESKKNLENTVNLEDIENIKIENTLKEIEKLKNEKIENNELEKDELEDDKLNIEEDNFPNIDLEELDDEDESSVGFRTRKESKENIEAGEKLLKDINDLITKQQNHAKIAGTIGTYYSALNNAFEMRKVAENLLELLRTINLKIVEICQKEQSEENDEKLEKISKVNIEISTLINYLNNPRIATRNTKATRFDEMAIIEENELKRGISEKARNIRGEAELKKLKEDLEIIEDKSKFSRFLGIFTGKNKLDEFLMYQIEVRRNAIKRTLSKKLDLAYNYSVHEIIAEIKMFIDENEDDQLVSDDVENLKEIEKQLKNNFVVLESKVQSIIDEKEGKHLPLDNKKLSKKDVIEIETYRFLNKYGYDNVSNIDKKEPQYQDTTANEIARIIEYINSSNVL